MNDDRLYMGIDGGGTRTTVLVADAAGHILTRKTGADTNFYIAGLRDSREKLMSIMRDVEHEVDMSRLARVFIGSSAVDYDVDEKTVQNYTQGILNCKVTMRSDAYAALAGHTLGGRGNLVISGTGSVGIAMNDTGGVFLSGGWGHLLGDDGSAYDIAIRGIRAAVRALDELGEATLLTQALIQKYNLQEPYGLIKCLTPQTSRPEIAAFSETVKQCADLGDSVSIRILRDAASYLAKLGARISMFSGSPVIAVYGSVLLKDKIVRNSFVEEYTRLVPAGIVTEPVLPAEAGAVILAMKEDGRTISKEIIARLGAA